MDVQLLDISQVQLAQLKAQEGLKKVQSQDAKEDPKLRQAAVDFEAVFIAQMLKPMMESVPTDSLMGGGHAEKMFRSMMVEEVGKSVAARGGVGLADEVFSELLKLQEM